MTFKMAAKVAIPLSPINISSTSRAIDKCLEEAQYTGEVILSGRQLKEYPKNSIRYDLSCVLVVDLSKNKLNEFPHELEALSSMEVLNLSHNILKSVPESMMSLPNLVCVNLNRNLLSTLPSSLGDLVHLEILLISNNKLVSIPEEICRLRKLMQLDVSCNQLSHLPPLIGNISSLQSLNLRQNMLSELPTSVGLLNLKFLDFSANRISRIPTEFGRMESLEVLLLDKNPLVTPPANVCGKGLVHVLAMLNSKATKDERRRSCLNLHGNSPRFGIRKFAGSTSFLSFSASTSPSLTPSSSFSKQSNNLGSLPPQHSRGNTNRVMSRSLRSSGEEIPLNYTNGDVHKHQRSSSFASGMVGNLPSPYVNGFTHHDSSTLGRRKVNFDAFPPNHNGMDFSIVAEGSQDEVDETRKTAMKLMDGTRRRRLSQGVDREDIQLATCKVNSSHDNSCLSQPPINDSHNSNTFSSVHFKNVLPMACRKALESMTQQLNDLDPGFTFKRTCRMAREEEDLIKRMQKEIESTLNIRLPGDFRGVFKDGIILCQFVNHLFPQTIPIIHMSGHPKDDLSIAKCRQNVDNFLVSCHTVGLSKAQICSAPAILDERSLSDVARTVLSLVNLVRGQTSV